MKRKYTAIIIIVVIVIIFNVMAISIVSKKEQPLVPPALNESALVIYGTIEPAGKAVYVSPKVSGIVKELYIREGDMVQSGQAICALENTVQDASSSVFLVTAPRGGLIYKCDIRVGETFNAGDRERITLGSPELQICCDIEILWIGKVDTARLYDVFNAETGENIGTGNYRSSSQYLRPKSIRTEEPGEKFSTQYQEVIMDFKPSKPQTLIGLPVMLKIRH